MVEVATLLLTLALCVSGQSDNEWVWNGANSDFEQLYNWANSAVPSKISATSQVISLQPTILFYAHFFFIACTNSIKLLVLTRVNLHRLSARLLFFPKILSSLVPNFLYISAFLKTQPPQPPKCETVFASPLGPAISTLTVSENRTTMLLPVQRVLCLKRVRTRRVVCLLIIRTCIWCG